MNHYDPGKKLSISRLIMLVMKSVKRDLSESMRSLGVDVSLEQIRLLHVINEFKEPVQQELSDHLLTDKSLLLRQLTSLEEEGLIMRISDRKDKRKKRVIITSRGLDLVNKTFDLRAKVIEEHLEGVSDDRRDVFYGVLMDMYTNANKRNK